MHLIQYLQQCLLKEENKVLEFYQKNPEASNAVRAPIFEEKVVDYIISKSTVKDIKVSADELFSDDITNTSTKKVSKKKNISKSKSAKK